MDYFQVLKDKISQEYERKLEVWKTGTIEDVLGAAEDIATFQYVHDHWSDSIHRPEDIAFLLQFENPLEIMSNKWIEENGSLMVHDEEFLHCVESLREEHVQECQRASKVEGEFLRKRINQNYADFVAEWNKWSPAELIENSGEIAAVRYCYETITAKPLEAETIEALREFANPLAALRDEYMRGNEIDRTTEWDNKIQNGLGLEM